MQGKLLLLSLILVVVSQTASGQSRRERDQWKYWCEVVKHGYVKVTPTTPICVVPPDASAPPNSTGPDPAEVERERIRNEKIKKAAEADRNGTAAANRGDWETAIGFYLDALANAPDDKTIREHLLRAQTALADERSAQEMAALRQRIEAALAAAEMEAFRQRMEVDVAAQAVKTLNDGFGSQAGGVPVSGSTPKLLRTPSGPSRRYSFSGQPIFDSTPTGKVLIYSKARVEAVDRELRQAQRALRNLIAQNSQSETLRLEWLKQHEEANIAAEDLAINLVLDLADEFLGDQLKYSNAEQGKFLNNLLSRTESKEVGLHTIYGSFLNHIDTLKERKRWIRSAKKNNDLQAKIREFSLDNVDLNWRKIAFWQKTAEDVHDVISSFEKGDEALGPYKNLIDTAYLMFKQAAALEVMAVTENNQKAILTASNSLQQHVRALVAEKQALQKAKRPLK